MMRIGQYISKMRVRKTERENARVAQSSYLHRENSFVRSLPFVGSFLVAAVTFCFAENLIAVAVMREIAPGSNFELQIYPFIVVPLVMAMLKGAAKTVEFGFIVLALLVVMVGFNRSFSAFEVAMMSSLPVSSIVMSAVYAPRIRETKDMLGLVLNIAAVQSVITVIFWTVIRYYGDIVFSWQYVLAQYFFYILYTVLSVPVAIYGLLPVAESFSYEISDYTLMRLANVNHPLLSRLAREAPATYHHSLMVADLAQAGAEAIGANGLLARVGGYFHDVGKLMAPAYFMENQMTFGNPHDDLPPSLSRMIIAAHVKEGLILARDEHLPTSIASMIASHHGTTFMQWFKLKAEKQKLFTGRNGRVAAEGFYRYPGPLPVSKEETILAIADSIEAASRSLPSYDKKAITNLVNNIVAGKFNDGQFAESELAGAELERVKIAFVSTLLSLLHGRKAYPPSSSKQ